MKVDVGLRIIVMNNIPYPPSFRRTATSTILPVIGTSTWALSSQSCRPYNGIFTMNSIIHASQIIILNQESFIGFAQYCSTSRLRIPVIF